MADTKDTTADAEKVKQDHKDTGQPDNPAGDPTDHSKSAAEITAQVDPKATSGAAVNAKTMDAVNEKADAQEAKDKADQDNSIVGKIRRSGLYFVRDHSTGRDYVGISPQNDPESTEASRRLSTVMPLDVVAPRTGMQIVDKDGSSFSIGDGHGPESLPADWAGITKADGSPLFA